ncbi:Putative glycosyl transferase CAP10 domain-containing protein [Septoria linicola]|uniref:Glycosyl transferase CAP10 domain-containing protein n=1 Tax=Septoria linicola TaxID=215465 RepID=A0A9Q9AMD9_9PEZI|nr:putative glycosyl transferase CAP10 domain-containing protein [Septoria linicola]USW51979.1 Putative glycosyl transferase CAP10 domain-containing protein [Septoria linicola]
MRTLALWGTLLLLISAALILWTTTKGAPDFAQDYIDNAAEYIEHHRPHKDEHVEVTPPPPSHLQPTHDGWVFDHKKHGRNYGLTEEQCSFAFPDLYREIDRAVEYRKKVGKITQDETKVQWRGDGIVKAQIHDNQLYVIDPHGVTDHNHRPRTLATLHAIHRAVSASPNKLPDIEFTFTVHDGALVDQDNGNETTWAYTRRAHQKSLWLMPDFGMWGWPDVNLRSYPELQTLLEHTEDRFEDKVSKVVWRGSLDVGSKDVREGLVRHAEDQEWADVQVLHWNNKTNIEEKLLTMQDHCSYKYVAQTEGNTYSGRLKYLLNCHSILLSHDLEWIELYHHLMKPSGLEQNYIQMKRDFSDLPKKMKKLLHPSKYDTDGQTIADNARRTFRERYLTPAAETCYWRALIRGWASVQGFEPQFWKEEEAFDKVTQKMKKTKRPRGAPFESYAIMEEVHWAIPAIPRKMCIKELDEEKCRDH